MSRRRGYIFIDTVAGLGLIGVIAGLLAVAVNRDQAAMHHLADRRTASRLAQSALVWLEQGRKPPADARLHMRALAAPAPTIAAKAWVEVTVTVNGQTERLVGLVPKEATP
jgi:hypothetical protein